MISKQIIDQYIIDAKLRSEQPVAVDADDLLYICDLALKEMSRGDEVTEWIAAGEIKDANITLKLPKPINTDITITIN